VPWTFPYISPSYKVEAQHCLLNTPSNQTPLLKDFFQFRNAVTDYIQASTYPLAGHTRKHVKNLLQMAIKLGDSFYLSKEHDRNEYVYENFSFDFLAIAPRGAFLYFCPDDEDQNVIEMKLRKHTDRK